MSGSSRRQTILALPWKGKEVACPVNAEVPKPQLSHRCQVGPNQHQAWIASAVNKGNPWSNSWGTPFPFDGVYTILAEFINNTLLPSWDLIIFSVPSEDVDLMVSGHWNRHYS